MVKRRRDASAHVTLTGPRFHGDVVEDTEQPAHVLHGAFGAFLLQQPLDLPGERDVSAMHRHLHGVGKRGPALERQEGVARDVRIGRPHHLTHGDVVGHGADAADALGHAFCRELLRVGVDEPGERHDTVVSADADGAGVDLRIPVELPHDGVSDMNVCSGDACGGHDGLLHSSLAARRGVRLRRARSARTRGASRRHAPQFVYRFGGGTGRPSIHPPDHVALLDSCVRRHARRPVSAERARRRPGPGTRGRRLRGSGRGRDVRRDDSRDVARATPAHRLRRRGAGVSITNHCDPRRGRLAVSATPARGSRPR